MLTDEDHDFPCNENNIEEDKGALHYSGQRPVYSFVQLGFDIKGFN
jgi:hypothetical protein